MNIDIAIEKLIEAKSKGAEEVEFFDSNWNEYGIEDINNPQPGGKIATALIFPFTDEDLEEEND